MKNRLMNAAMFLLSMVSTTFIRTLHATLRVRHIDSENITRLQHYIITFWHGHLLLMLHSRFRKPIAVMSSLSRDGEYIARVFYWYGVHCVRGSSSRRGTAALRALIRESRLGKNIVFTPDGPKGPYRVAKDGIIFAAMTTGLPIVPIAFAAKKKSCSSPGTGWSSRIPSRRRSTSTASRSSCRVTRTWKSSASASKGS